MSTQTDLLRKIDFFEPLDQKIINKIAQVCIDREYSKGEYIVKQGESGLGLFFITSGRVKVELERNGARAVVATLQSEDFLGELSIIDNKPRSAHVICLEDTSCLLLTRDSFSKLVNKYPEISIQMAKALAGRIRAANEKMGQPLPASQEAAPPSKDSVAQPESVAAAAPVESRPAPGNGKASESSAKNKVKDFLVDTFSFLYTMKAMTRFSAAVVGCPVEVQASPMGVEVTQAVVEGVKVMFFPAREDQVIRIDAYDDGAFSATVFQTCGEQSAALISRFDGCVVRDERMHLHVPRDQKAWLQRESADTKLI